MLIYKRKQTMTIQKDITYEQTQHIPKKLVVQNQFLELRKTVLNTLPEKAESLILDMPHAKAFVRSFPNQDLYLLIQDIGPEDAVTILSLASKKQWQYILDVQTWDKDKLQIEPLTKWLYLLIQADPERLVKWLFHEEKEFIEYYCAKNIEVVPLDEGEDNSFLPDHFVTLDGTFYYGTIEERLSVPLDADTMAMREDFIKDFFSRLANLDYEQYQNFVNEIRGINFSESEEELYQRRMSRLQETGFLPFDEAIGIYHPVKDNEWKQKQPKFKFFNVSGYPKNVPYYTNILLDNTSDFSNALKQMNYNDYLLFIEEEFAFLCNQIISADLKIIQGKDHLSEVVKKACGYLSIGLSYIIQTTDFKKFQQVLVHYPLQDIFRIGYSCALQLKWKAEKWRNSCWFLQAGFSLKFWDELWVGVLGGLFLKKPLYYNQLNDGLLFKEFQTLDEIHTTETQLNEIIAMDQVLSLFSVSIKPNKSNFRTYVTYKNVLLTLWCRSFLKRPVELSPISKNDFTQFFNQLWDSSASQRQISLEMKQSFMAFIQSQTQLIEYEIMQKIGPTLDSLFNEIELEYQSITTIDPRFIVLFLLE